MKKTIPGKAICIRNSSSWADLKPEYKFDSSKFDPEALIKRLPILSPKMNALLNKIEELDAKDMKTENRLYKHIIYSDVAGVYGAKMVASVLISHGYKMAFNDKIKSVDRQPSKTFALLTMSSVYQKPLTVGYKKKILKTLNNRPDNVYGDDIRFLVIDSGFKEGIDVFDVKYVHLLEPLVTKAEQTQVIGRGTRYCGQAGLDFQPGVGWPLHVFRYNMMYDDEITLHELYVKNCDNNISSLNFVADIEDLLLASACDLVLTANIHNFDPDRNRFLNMIPLLPKKTIFAQNKAKVVGNLRGKIFTNVEDIKCNKRCSGKLETAHVGILLVAALYVNKGELLVPLRDKFPKPQLCQYIDKIPSYCKAINMLWSNPSGFLKVYKSTIQSNYDYLKKSYAIHENNIKRIDDFLENHEAIKAKQNMPTGNVYKAVPPNKRLSNAEMGQYITNHFSSYKWPEIEVKNMCVKDKTEDEDNAPKSNSNIISFTNTQKFVKDFVTPASPHNGIFLYHSVGSGKTCTAIATATNSFDKEGYTILWVTRHTLKEDIWKNMFESVCNVIIQERLQNGEVLPASMSDKMKMLGDNWLSPISYKQFTNMIAGKNKLYEEMVRRNGKEDPFQKTFIVIDEIHKIYSDTLSHLEKPDPSILKNMVQHSYEMSRKDKNHKSLKLLLMSATPITEDPMSVVKILNLLLTKSEEFPEDFETFRSMYCMENGLFTDNGARKFMDNTSGLISYIDRTNDISHFAYPIISDILLKAASQKKNNNIDNLQQKLKDAQDKLHEMESNEKNIEKGGKIAYKDAVKTLKQDIKKMSKEIKQLSETELSNNFTEYINKCFSKNNPKPKKIGTSRQTSKPKQPKPCKDGKIRNEKGRCVKRKITEQMKSYISA